MGLHEAIWIHDHKERINRFTNKSFEYWSNLVHDGALSVRSQWHEPPGIDDLSTVVLSAWATNRAYISAGG